MEQATSMAEAIRKGTVEKDGRATLACPVAFQIAGKCKVSIAEIGAYCNENDIKIVKCQLGCFE